MNKFVCQQCNKLIEAQDLRYLEPNIYYCPHCRTGLTTDEWCESVQLDDVTKYVGVMANRHRQFRGGVMRRRLLIEQ